MSNLTNGETSDKLPVKDGWIACPQCGRKLIHIRPETESHSLPIFCRGCRTEILLEIERGLSARRLSP